MDKITQLKECVDKITKDAYKFFEKNNKAAGVRTRKKLQKCKRYAQEIRNLIQKSKQELVQKKTAAAANAAVLNTNKFVECSSVKVNIGKLELNKNECFGNLDHNSLPDNENGSSFTKECIKHNNLLKNTSSIQEYSRIESLPSLDGDRIDILR